MDWVMLCQQLVRCICNVTAPRGASYIPVVPVASRVPAIIQVSRYNIDTVAIARHGTDLKEVE